MDSLPCIVNTFRALLAEFIRSHQGAKLVELEAAIITKTFVNERQPGNMISGLLIT
jgi:hypothetical protein